MLDAEAEALVRRAMADGRTSLKGVVNQAIVQALAPVVSFGVNTR